MTCREVYAAYRGGTELCEDCFILEASISTTSNRGQLKKNSLTQLFKHALK
jgi:hypothetical protein